jgi:hypothetical protein
MTGEIALSGKDFPAFPNIKLYRYETLLQEVFK